MYKYIEVVITNLQNIKNISSHNRTKEAKSELKICKLSVQSQPPHLRRPPQSQQQQQQPATTKSVTPAELFDRCSTVHKD